MKMLVLKAINVTLSLYIDEITIHIEAISALILRASTSGARSLAPGKRVPCSDAQ